MMGRWCIMVVLALAVVATARKVPSEAGLGDQKNFLTYGGVGGFSGVGSNGLPFGGVGAGVGGGFGGGLGGLGGAGGFGGAGGTGGAVGGGVGGGSGTGVLPYP